MEFSVHSPSDLLVVAKHILSQVAEQNTILLFGDLGSGKTTLVSKFYSLMNPLSTVSSPTFSIVNEYPLENLSIPFDRVYHIDLYRLKDTDELINAGIEDILYKDAVIFIEWPELAVPLLPDETTVQYVTLNVLGNQKRKVVAL